MHTRRTLMMSLGLSFIGMGCEQRGVEAELKDLQAAREDAPRIAEELERELNEAASEVIRLQEKLALARRGITDDVLNERADLAEALRAEGEDVYAEIDQAQTDATSYNQLSIQARRVLRETEPARVRAEVKTETQITPQPANIEQRREETTIPLDITKVRGLEDESKDEGAAQSQQNENTNDDPAAEQGGLDFDSTGAAPMSVPPAQRGDQDRP